MNLVYADTSALVRAYFADEPDHLTLRKMLLEGNDPVVTSELARIEFASAVRGAHEAHRLGDPAQLRARFDADGGPDGPLQLLRLRIERVGPVAYRLVCLHRLRTLDALHLATALEELPAIAGLTPVLFVTRDDDQAAAAISEGLSVA